MCLVLFRRYGSFLNRKLSLGRVSIDPIAGVSESLLKEMGVRLVSIDRPGYRGSEFNTKQTFETAAQDVAEVADLLDLGRKIWLLGYGCGGAYYWAAARYIPERIGGIAMWAPVRNYHWQVCFANRAMICTY